MLTDKAVKNAKAAEGKPVKLADALGLYLYVKPNGGKVWRFKYRHGGKEKLLTLGSYEDVSLVEAREARDAARRQLRGGQDPAAERRLQKIAGVAALENSFETIARAWHARKAPTWDDKHATSVLRSLERDIFPHIGREPINSLTAPIINGLVRRIEARSPEVALRLCERMDKIFTFAITSGIGHANPAAVVRPGLHAPSHRKQPAIVDIDQAREMLKASEASPAHPVTRLALRFLAITAVRPGVIGGTAWTEFEGLAGKEPLWRIPAERMKGLRAHKREHLVPLPTQAVELLRALSTQSGKGPLAFPNGRWAHKPMSANAIGYLLNRAGYHSRHVPHGWRSTFSTVMNERDKDKRWIIDLMLGHTADETVERRYNRSELLQWRRDLAQEWADILLVDALPLWRLLEGARR